MQSEDKLAKDLDALGQVRCENWLKVKLESPT